MQQQVVAKELLGRMYTTYSLSAFRWTQCNGREVSSSWRDEKIVVNSRSNGQYSCLKLRSCSSVGIHKPRTVVHSCKMNDKTNMFTHTALARVVPFVPFTGCGNVSLTTHQAWVVIMHLNHSKLAPSSSSNGIANIGRVDEVLCKAHEVQYNFD